jgi:hypothetical protein
MHLYKRKVPPWTKRHESCELSRGESRSKPQNTGYQMSENVLTSAKVNSELITP